MSSIKRKIFGKGELRSGMVIFRRSGIKERFYYLFSLLC